MLCIHHKWLEIDIKKKIGIRLFLEKENCVGKTAMCESVSSLFNSLKGRFLGIFSSDPHSYFSLRWIEAIARLALKAVKEVGGKFSGRENRRA